MIDTFLSRNPQTASPAGRSIASEGGFMLIEVMISAMLVALIVVAMFNGFDATSRVTADERSHSQADVLAQQDEDRLRGMQVSLLSGLSQTQKVTFNGTVYEIKSTAKFVSDATGTESCTAETASADYIQTTSEVSWPALKARPRVVETGLIAPRLGGSLLVQVLSPSGKGVSGMTVTATGPSPSKGVETATTGTNGCVVFGSVEPGEYKVTTYQAGYVEKDGNSEPPSSEQSATVINGSTTKKEFEFGQAGAIKVTFAGGASSDQWLAFNTGMTTFRTFGTAETYNTAVTSPTTMFPFTSPYTVYAGSCESDDPHAVNAAVTDPVATVVGGTTVEPSPSVTVPPVAIKVWSGKNIGTPGKQIEGAQVWIEDTGCKTIRKSTTTSKGALLHPNMPFGKYRLCVTGGPEGGKNGVTKELGKKRKYTYTEGTTFTNDTATGPSALATMTDDGGALNEGAAAVYLEAGATVNAGAELKEGTTCP
jgi:Tfp pilus assembly protein PilV